MSTDLSRYDRIVAEALAEGWDRCAREFALNALNSATHEAAMRALRANPYRAALDADTIRSRMMKLSRNGDEHE